MHKRRMLYLKRPLRISSTPKRSNQRAMDVEETVMTLEMSDDGEYASQAPVTELQRENGRPSRLKRQPAWMENYET
ncbi:MAG: hypothetical protein LN560_01860, partial [Rickettsia endosymbiont of Sceptobius lativentris]|nr:hypothetical protein [Rickettsia endosymbiont of Sceptobius lativentris]